MVEYTRRRMLAATAGIAGLGALAGCSGGSGATNTDVQSSFFVFGDIVENVAATDAKTDLLVPVGQHGHGWEPGPRIREDIYDAALFAHGMAGFQPWADDIIADLDADGADVTTVDVSGDVSLLGFDGGGHGEHSSESHHDEHETEHHDEHGTEHHDEHDHGAMDPHFWMDPTRVATAADTVRRAMEDYDGDNADSYAENAEAYQTRLADLDERIESALADASKGVLLVAGHDAFGYLAERYGVRVEALTDASPDDEPTLNDRERARSVIQEHGLRYICADPLESQTMAEELVAETDVEAVLPLTAMPGLKDEWADSDWGYVDVMEQVNLPTLAKALEAR
jgi:zinc transport system substrate-binding protein